MSDIPPPAGSSIPRKHKSGGNWGGGRPKGQLDPIPAPTEVIVDSVVELNSGLPVKEVAEKHELRVEDVRRIQTLTGLTPQQYFDAMGDRIQPVLDDVLQLIHQKTKDVLAGNDVATLNQAAVTFGILRDHLADIRGQSRPTQLHQTNIQINNLSRDEARKLILGNQS